MSGSVKSIKPNKNMTNNLIPKEGNYLKQYQPLHAWEINKPKIVYKDSINSLVNKCKRPLGERKNLKMSKNSFSTMSKYKVHSNKNSKGDLKSINTTTNCMSPNSIRSEKSYYHVNASKSKKMDCTEAQTNEIESLVHKYFLQYFSSLEQQVVQLRKDMVNVHHKLNKFEAGGSYRNGAKSPKYLKSPDCMNH